MIILDKVERLDHPFIESLSLGHSSRAATITRPADVNRYLVLSKRRGTTEMIAAGPFSEASHLSYDGDCEMIWIKLRLGVCFRAEGFHVTTNAEVGLPGDGRNRFSLGGREWEFPSFEQGDLLVDRLARGGILRLDPLVSEALLGSASGLSPRGLRDRFLRSTGLSRRRIAEVLRARKAAESLASGKPILEVALDLGYYDQPHLGRSLRKYLGRTPGSFYQMNT